ncbi:MAG: asparagine synthase (glutamine-hydrolyzing) [Geminicoccaceae bacterium]
MCGLAAIFAYHGAAPPVDERELVAIRDAMAARGPDGAGLWLHGEGRIGLAHRRLAIIDLDPRADQPMVSACGRFRIVFNGEIYNYRELRRELLARGTALRTTSDTEVLLELWARDGAACLSRLRGMYAFAVWDELERVLTLVRDPYGIKPLYCADDGWTVRAASQVKALLAGGRIPEDEEPAGIAGFWLWGSVPEPFTTLRAVCAVPAGHLVRVDALGAHAPEPFCRIEEELARAEAAAVPADPIEALRAAVVDSVRCHLEADVPVGVFLSSGIDSCAMVAAIRALGADRAAATTAITLTFPEWCGRPDDEAPLAAEAARAFGVRHQVVEASEAEFRADLPRILEVMDQPTIDGVNSWLVSKAAASLGLKVALSGTGGDELFGGYPSFADLPRWRRGLALPASAPLVGRLLRALLPRLAPDLAQRQPKLAGVFEHGGSWPGLYLLRRGLFLPHELPALMGRERAREGLRRLGWHERTRALLARGPRSPFGRVSALETCLYLRNQLLRDLDWASMAHSLEVRVPFVDLGLLHAAAPIAAAHPGKALLARAMDLPEAIARRPKTGFTTPVGAWIAREAGEDPRVPWARRWAGEVIGAPTAGRPSRIPVRGACAA